MPEIVNSTMGEDSGALGAAARPLALLGMSGALIILVVCLAGFILDDRPG